VDDSGIMQRSSTRSADRQQGRSVDDSVVQSKLSESFSRTVKDWERVRQSRSKSQTVPATTLPQPPPPLPAARKPSSVTDDRSKSRDRDRQRQRAEKELGKLAKKEQKLEEEMRRLVAARIKLEGQLESSSASDRGGGNRDSDWGASPDDGRLLAALDVTDRSPVAFLENQARGRSKSSRLRRQSCMTSTMPSSCQRATSVGNPANRKWLSAAGPRSDTDRPSDDGYYMSNDDVADDERVSDSRGSDPAKLSPK